VAGGAWPRGRGGRQARPPAAWGDGAGGLLVELVEEVVRVILGLEEALESGGAVRHAPLCLGAVLEEHVVLLRRPREAAVATARSSGGAAFFLIFKSICSGR